MFTRREIDRRCTDELLQFCVPLNDDEPVILSLDDFTKMISKLRDSAPGPDNLPYSAWKNSGPLLIAHLHTLYVGLMEGLFDVPDGFNLMRMVFIP